MNKVERARISAYEVPTPTPEADGTLVWEKTVLVVVELWSSGNTEVAGVGYTYADLSTATILEKTLVPLVLGKDPLPIPAHLEAMRRAVRNLGSSGIAAMGISALEMALWDLKARSLKLSLADLLGKVREEIPVYGSGGFINFEYHKLEEQLKGWLEKGIELFKIKIGHSLKKDLERVSFVREMIGKDKGLFVDANGAYDVPTAAKVAQELERFQVSWFEEPVSSKDLWGLGHLRSKSPPGMSITAGEYGQGPNDFRQLLEHKAVDCLQIDATRCEGVSGFVSAASLAQSFNTPVSAHTAPTIHAHLCCAVPGAIHVEYFSDHERIEYELFQNELLLKAGKLVIPSGVQGLGVQLREKEANSYKLAQCYLKGAGQ